MKKVVWKYEFDNETKYPFCPYCNEFAYKEEKCLFCGKPYEWVEEETATVLVEFEGYKVVQTSNNHIHLYKDSKLIMHIPCTRKMTVEELKKEVDFYKMITEKNNVGKMEDQKN